MEDGCHWPPAVVRLTGMITGTLRIASTSAVALAALTGLAGCAAFPAGGPLLFGGAPTDSSTVCIPVEDGGRTVVSDYLAAPTGQAITFEHIELVDADGVTVVDGYLVPLDGTNLPIIVGAYPPAPAEAWAGRTPLAGAALAPGAEMSLAVILERDSESAASSAPFRITYRVGETTFTKQGSQSYELVDRCS